MAVKLSQLRVSADMDASGYVGGMAQKVAADERGIASGEALGKSLAQQDVAAGNAGGSLGRLSKTYIDGYGSAAKFYTAVNSLQKQVELGNVTGEKAALIYQGIVKQFGMVASAAELAGKGNADFAKIVGDVNARVDTNVVALGQQRNATGLARYELINLSRQLQDVGVSLVSGQSPFTVMVQQGTQIADVFANTTGTVGGFFRQAIGGVTSFLTPLRLLSLGAVAAGAAAYAMNAAWKASALELDNTARVIDTTITQLRGLDRLASIKGIEDFSKDAERLASSIYQAQNGMGGLGDVLRANGERATDFVGTLQAASRIIQRSTSDQQRLQLLQQMGLPATMEWVRFLQQGSDQIAQAANDANGFVAKEQELVDKARQFDEAWSSAWKGFKAGALDAYIASKGWLTELWQLSARVRQYFNPTDANARTTASFGDLGSYQNPALANALQKRAGQMRGDAPAVDPAAAARALQLEQQRIQMLGDFATVAEKVRLKEIEIQQARANGVTVTKEAEKALLGLAAAQETANRAQMVVSALGSAATVTEQYDAKVKQLQATLASGVISQEQYNRALAGLKQDQHIQALQDTISALGDVAPLTKQYELRIAELQQMLDQGRISQETFNEAVKAADPAFKSLRDATNGFGQDLLSSLMSGKGAFESLTGAASKYISTLANGTLQRVQNGGSLFGNQSLFSGQGALGIASAGLSGYQSGSPLGGAIGGAMAGATFGPIGAVVGGAAGLIGGLFGADAQKKAAEEAHQKEVQAAKDAWDRMEGQWKEFIGALTGSNIGSVQKSMTDYYQQTSQYIQAIAKANDLHAGDATPADIIKTQQAFDQWQQKTTAEFYRNWGRTVDALNSGIGLDSPFAKGVDNLKSVAEQVAGFVSDTLYITTGGTGVENDLSRVKVAQARDAAQTYLLTLLDAAPAVSATQEAIGELNGKADALKQVLIDLGMASDVASAAINERLAGAMDKLRSDFVDSLQRTLNDTTDKGYINDIADAVKQHQQDLADSAALGVSGDLADQIFNARVQKIVDGAGLVGDAFADLSAKFPDLVGVVTDTAKSIQELIDGLRVGDKSTLSPQERLAAAQSLYERDLAKANAGDSAALSALTSEIDTFLSLAKDYYASTAGYVDIYNQVTADLAALAAKSSFQNGGVVGFYAGGGPVGNGVWNKDSVRARYAAGGDIMLAGGEFVNRATSVNGSTLPVLDYINRTGRAPVNDNGPSRQNFVDLMRQNTAGFSAVVAALREEVGELRATIERQGRQNASLLTRPDRPGGKKKAA